MSAQLSTDFRRSEYGAAIYLCISYHSNTDQRAEWLRTYNNA